MKHHSVMEDQDPWNINEIEVNDSLCNQFEDNFTVSTETDRLPDSEEYLASLENKLAKLKSVKGNKKADRKELIRSLEESNESCMYRLIAGDSYSVTEQDLLLETPTNLSAKWIKSQVNPEQALTVGELVQLVKADYLAQEAADTNTTDPSSDQ